MKQEVAQTATQAAPDVQGKLLEMLDAIQHGAIHIGDQIIKYSPDAVDVVLWVVRINGIESVIRTCLFGGISVVSWVLCRMFYKWNRKACEEKDNKSCEDWVGWMCVTGIMGAGATLIFLFILCSVWDWVAIFQPKLFLAKEIMQSIIK
jgi:hypothetical protein